MSRTSRIIIAAIMACFFGGVGFSLWRAKQHRLQMANALPLRILCADKWLSPEVIDRFAREHRVPVQLFTYGRPSEFLRQMANADGKVDVICSSSFLTRSLVRSRWLKKEDYAGVDNAKTLAVDFLHMPYDPRAEFGLPLFWNLYGFFGKGDQVEPTLKQTLSARKVALWGEELNVLSLLTHSGVRIEERLEQEDNRGLDNDIHEFVRSITQVVKPGKPLTDAAAFMGKADWVIAPLSRVSTWLDKEHHFVLPEDGAAMEVGLLSVGEKSPQPELALALINELMDPKHALATHKRLGAGVVHSTLDNVDSISAWQRPQALRQFPLNRLRFPDLNVETLPRFEKIYDQNLGSDRN
ncbi:MAG: hypothetical protein KF799_11520 [Bdellovibrionales bacterium]|nr:hypothetical protein [Bdellovibrionales bacterium]